MNIVPDGNIAHIKRLLQLIFDLSNKITIPRNIKFIYICVSRSIYVYFLSSKKKLKGSKELF